MSGFLTEHNYDLKNTFTSTYKIFNDFNESLQKKLCGFCERSFSITCYYVINQLKLFFKNYIKNLISNVNIY